MEALCLYAEPSSRASNPPSLKGYEDVSGAIFNLPKVEIALLGLPGFYLHFMVGKI